MKRKYQQTLKGDGTISIRKNSKCWNVYLNHSAYLNYKTDFVASCSTKKQAIEIANDLYDYHATINNAILNC